MGLTTAHQQLTNLPQALGLQGQRGVVDAFGTGEVNLLFSTGVGAEVGRRDLYALQAGIG